MINRLVIENLRHRPIRTLLTVVAIGLQVTLVLTIVGLSRGLIDASIARTKGVGADIMVRPPGTSAIGMSTAPMSEKIVDVVSREPHVAIATGTMVHPIGGLDSITGINFEEFNKLSGGLDYYEGGPFQTKHD
ncbi:MAG: ABC transporter permease, partial [Bryobacteraceae bacterium]